MVRWYFQAAAEALRQQNPARYRELDRQTEENAFCSVQRQNASVALIGHNGAKPAFFKISIHHGPTTTNISEREPALALPTQIDLK